ncbi:MAG TPA: aspartate aminotransferase family protein [Ferruginibacter sp.]|nr:aspartate aminotransferase family protein [Ferruginibacter sp.]HRO16959.1 aspartate aminotransferase family protein [Ferruginibacter sp.]
MNQRQLFLNHVGQTSEAPLAIHMVRAQGSRLWDANDKEYIDWIAGIGVCNVGHCHPAVVEAIREQSARYLHIMVYGELVENPQVAYAQFLTNHLPESLQSVFFTTGGSEATEGAMKLAKRYTGRTQIISFKNSYHGSTQGALSIMGSEYWKQAYRPLLPDVMQLEYNRMEDLSFITDRTACVVAETIQAEAGVNVPQQEWLTALRKRCTDTGALLVLDEIQCGFGRNGSLWAFELFDIVPDVLLLGKALGGGMPLGAFIAKKSIMQSLTHQPVLGHINTFGGHPVSCAAGLAAMQALFNEKMIPQVAEKETLFLSLLKHKRIQRVSSKGLMMAVWFNHFEENKSIIDALIEKGVFTDWFLFASNALRIVPPLNISEEDIRTSCALLLEVLDQSGKA